MKKMNVLVVSVILLILVFTSGCSNKHAEEMEQLKQQNALLLEIAAPLPASLDSLFPPVAEAPVYLMQMFKLSTPFSGILIDLLEGDPTNAMGNFERFRAAYIETSRMVPEWQNRFPMEPVDILGNALKTGEMGKISGAYEVVGEVCYQCHSTFMVNVQLKYHWEDFSELEVDDPVSGEGMMFIPFKHGLVASLDGISIDLEEGEIENAQKHFLDFNARFQELKRTCNECHLTPRSYYVNEPVQAMIDQLGKEINKPTIDQERVGDLMMGIGMEGCFGCHLVHLPSQNFKWNQGKYSRLN